MSMEPHRRVFMETAHSCLNVPYEWGGNNPLGLDCSGYVCWCLKAAGLLRYNEDAAADGLWHRFSSMECPTPRAGAMVFWFNANDKAYHIGICYSDTHYYGAEGGGSAVEDKEDADLHNAFVRLAPLSGRSGKRRYAYPWGTTT